MAYLHGMCLRMAGDSLGLLVVDLLLLFALVDGFLKGSGGATLLESSL
jgi:hypothetical protein